jgi:hypothetical protein
LFYNVRINKKAGRRSNAHPLNLEKSPTLSINIPTILRNPQTTPTR